MADFNFTVDTEPLARQVSTVSRHVTGVTVAVTAMQAAVIAAEKSSMETICSNVDRGFYFLVRSQISQKAARLSSEVSSKLMALGQLGLALKGVHRQMEGDYGMISSRYLKIFRSLDANLRNRVLELDKDASRLALSHRSEVYARVRDSGCAFLLHQRESVPTAQAVVASKVKRNAARGIETISRQLGEEAILGAQLAKVVADRPAERTRLAKIPVILSEADSLVGAGKYSAVTIPDMPAAYGSLRGDLEAALREGARSLAWGEPGQGSAGSVRERYVEMLEGREIDDRTKKEMLRLFDASAWQETAGESA